MIRPGHEHCEAVILSLERECATIRTERDGFGLSAQAYATDLQKAGKEIEQLRADLRAVVEAAEGADEAISKGLLYTARVLIKEVLDRPGVKALKEDT